ncbi:methylenetetrahydrofolate reductase [Pseudomyrmex gracilis]|uniref:methylenetetrahydrofolate reductase n=1 Tax=Pseudomyrmex gracilis TaxID=219809 RepID=UPI00099536F7|nr:methylenetetrahydrofolate reductase [Pseudomyrmex gracilis]
MRNFVLEETPRKERDGNDDEDKCFVLGTQNNCSRKIVDLRQLLNDKFNKNEIFCSFEIVSQRKPAIFYQRLLADMDKYLPLFYSLTWHDKAVSNDDYLPLNVAKSLSSNTLLHLTAKGFKRNQIIQILRKALDLGIINIFALRGDSLSKDGDFNYAADLVAFIRDQFGDTFCIFVAGYPQTHPNSPSKERDLYYLKLKVETGADFIITQICFESQIFVDFVRDCRRIGIEIPIVAGIFTPPSYDCLEKMTYVCKLDVPIEIKANVAQIKNDDEAVRKYATDLTVRFITDVIRSKTTCGFHLIALNRLSQVADVCKHIEFLKMGSKDA